MKNLPIKLCLLALVCSCNASAEDCEKLGDKWVELYEAELTEASKELPPEVLRNAAEAGRAEVVDQCKKETYSKASVDRCLGATSMAQFEAC